MRTVASPVLFISISQPHRLIKLPSPRNLGPECPRLVPPCPVAFLTPPLRDCCTNLKSTIKGGRPIALGHPLPRVLFHLIDTARYQGRGTEGSVRGEGGGLERDAEKQQVEPFTRNCAFPPAKRRDKARLRRCFGEGGKRASFYRSGG